MAKKRRKKSNKQQPPFWADQVLAVLNGLGFCCCLSILGAFNVGFAALIKESLPKNIKLEQLANQLSTKQYAIALPVFFGIWFILTILAIWYTIALWRGRKWVFLYLVIVNAAGILSFGWLMLTPSKSNDLNYSVNGSGNLVILVYSILRLAGKVGPKPT